MPILRADWVAVMPVLALLGGAIAVLAVDLLLRRDARRTALEPVAYLALGAAIVLAVLRLPEPGGTHFVGALREDMLSRLAALSILAATVLTVLLSGEACARRNLRPAEFLSLVLFASAGMMLMTMSADLIALFLNLELMSLAVYVLTGMARNDRGSNEAAVKYFINGSFASAFLLFGMALVYGGTGTLVLAEMGRARGGVLATAGLTLMLAGFGFKVGAVPFHFWVPDTYEGAPTAVTAYMSVAVKTAGFAALLRVVFAAFPGTPEVWMQPLSVAAALTMIVGNVMAVVQESVKRMLAYSGVAHTGYALVGVVSGSAPAAIFYLFVYTFMTFGAFAFLMLAGGKERDADRIGDYAGLARRSPWSAAAMSLFLVSLGGIPPTAGFFGKFVLFDAGLRAGQTGLVVLGVLTSAVSLYYYLRVIVYMYMKEPVAGAEPVPADPGIRTAVFIAGFATLALGLAPTRYLHFAAECANLLPR